LTWFRNSKKARKEAKIAARNARRLEKKMAKKAMKEAKAALKGEEKGIKKEIFAIMKVNVKEGLKALKKFLANKSNAMRHKRKVRKKKNRKAKAYLKYFLF